MLVLRVQEFDEPVLEPIAQDLDPLPDVLGVVKLTLLEHILNIEELPTDVLQT